MVFHLMAKPVGPRCNMACRYCFYLEKSVWAEPAAPRMSDAVLEAYIREVALTSTAPEVAYAWQGGEPTLAGLDFFRRAVALQQAYARGRPVTNAFQTNGTLLDDRWCAFLAEQGFLVGISLDGPEPLHAGNRVDAAGQSRFDDILAAVERMRENGVSFNTLTAIHRRNARAPIEVYRFLRDLGVEHMQFIPIVERKPDARAEALGIGLAPPLDPDRPGGRQAVTPWSVKPDDYGTFLCAIFDEWIRNDVGRVFVQGFEAMLGSRLGMPPSLCLMAPRCGQNPILEQSGDVYACDHYVYPEYRLGNILETPLSRLLTRPELQALGDRKEALPPPCRACAFRAACNGGCPKHRFVRPTATEPPMPYLCSGYRRFFEHADPWIHRLAGLVRQGRPAADIMQVSARYPRSKKAGT